ncbi:MAG: MalY/PatB family protein [Eubacteriaceae bacterium]
MKYNFDKIIDRHGTGSMKWDGADMLKSAGITDHFNENTLPLFTADMDFECPPSVKEEIQKVVDQNLYGYTILDPKVQPEYYQAVTDWFRRRHDWDIKPEEMVYTDGTVNAVGYAIRAFSAPGDGIFINRPIYTPFTTTILRSGRRVVNSQLINQDGIYSVDFEDFEKKAAEPGTSCMILCNPHNPTGRIWSDDDLNRMYEICQKNDIIVISDEIHGDLIRLDKTFHPLATLVDGKNLVTCTAANKSFNLAGLKCTNVVITNPELRKQFTSEVGMMLPTPFAIAATIGAYNGGEEWLDELRTYIDGNFDWVERFCRDHLPKMKMTRPEGTYILWMDFREYGLTAKEIRRKIYVDANVTLETGKMFDPDHGAGFERICLSTRREIVREAFERIAAQFQGL